MVEPVPLSTRAVARSDTGQVRRRNEDAVRVAGSRGALVVADGMGGHPAGDVASALAAEEAFHRLLEIPVGLPAEEVSAAALGERMGELVRKADERVREGIREDPSLDGMGTTLTAMLLDAGRGRAFLGHVGDSRAYRLRDGVLELLTRDHTWVQEQVDQGRLSPAQARAHPYASVLTRVLGLEGPVQPDVVDVEALPGDVFLLCSDGLTAMLTDPDIEATLNAGLPEGIDAAADALVRAANEEGGVDNITVALLAVERS